VNTRSAAATLSKSQVWEMAKDLDSQVEQFRSRRLDDAGPFTFVAADALVLKVREGGRVVPVHAWRRRVLMKTGTDKSSACRSRPARTAPAGALS
jgi:transposase-like protein